MKKTIDCNVHLCGFSKDMEADEYDKLHSNKPLGLDGTFKFEYDYPLNTEAVFEHQLTSEMTALDILEIGQADYERIYREEDEDVGGPTENIPGMLNRQISEGRYGIWGHSIGDLYFEGIEISGNKISFSMGS